MSVEVHLLSHDYEEFLPWSIRHYQTFASTIIIHDGGPDGWSTITANRLGCSAQPWDTGGKLNDELAMNLKNECWKGTQADFVICADADELIYFPAGAEQTLATYNRIGAAVIRPEGYEMFADFWPDVNEGKQIYDYVKHGAPDDKWYAKPILFSPKLVQETGFGIGAHEALPVLHDGRVIPAGPKWPHPNPRCFLLHCHQIGPVDRIARRYDETRARLSAQNEQHRWGNFKLGLVHAQEKRDYILPRLTQVIA